MSGIDLNEKVILITGASAGIGREIARLVAGKAKRLILVARRRERLEELRGELLKGNSRLEVEIYPLDLTDRGALKSFADQLVEKGGVDILINNAGYGDMSLFDLARWERLEGMLELNIRALVYLTYRLLPQMKERGRGGILNISSAYGLTFGPGFAVYIGTKHFVTGFTEGLRVDLSGTGIVVSQVCPGPVETEFSDVMGNFLEHPVPRLIALSAEKCARDCIRALEKGVPLTISANFFGKLLVYSGLFTPRWLRRLVFKPVARFLRKRQLLYLEKKGEGDKYLPSVEE